MPADTTTEAVAKTRPRRPADLPDRAPIPRGAYGAALNEQGSPTFRPRRLPIHTVARDTRRVEGLRSCYRPDRKMHVQAKFDAGKVVPCWLEARN
jgi:hypothetical protein